MSESAPSYLGVEYGSKRADYFTTARRDFVAMLPVDPAARILELGCGDGATGVLALREGKCGTYVGIEMFEPMAREAAKNLTAVHVGDVQNMDLPYPPGSFDALICSEVLEHLVDPDAVLIELAKLVKPGGLVLASSPNVSHWQILRELFFGRFDYSDFGAMDRTHLRWFTPRSFTRMFEAADINVLSVGPHARVRGLKKLLYASLGRWKHLVWYQIQLIGQKR